MNRFWSWFKRQTTSPKAPLPEVPLSEAGLLLLIQHQLQHCGLKWAADTQLTDAGKRLMVAEGRLAITVDFFEAKEEQIHAHIASWLPGSKFPDGAMKLDACVVGIGNDALPQVADKWLQLVAAPVLSCLAASPQLSARHFTGDEEWAVPDKHGFVGPLVTHGHLDAYSRKAIADSDLFAFDGYPTDRKLHLVKVVLSGQNGRWKRNLEIDGHDICHHDQKWLTGVLAPESFVYCVCYAVFWDDQAVMQGPSHHNTP